MAILQLNASVSFNSSVRPVCLPGKPDRNLDGHEGHFVTVTGWGHQNQHVNNDGLVHAPLRVFSKRLGGILDGKVTYLKIEYNNLDLMNYILFHSLTEVYHLCIVVRYIKNVANSLFRFVG